MENEEGSQIEVIKCDLYQLCIVYEFCKSFSINLCLILEITFLKHRMDKSFVTQVKLDKHFYQFYPH